MYYIVPYYMYYMAQASKLLYYMHCLGFPQPLPPAPHIFCSMATMSALSLGMRLMVSRLACSMHESNFSCGHQGGGAPVSRGIRVQGHKGTQHTQTT